MQSAFALPKLAFKVRLVGTLISSGGPLSMGTFYLSLIPNSKLKT
jgi:hypothetical protein